MKNRRKKSDHDGSTWQPTGNYEQEAISVGRAFRCLRTGNSWLVHENSGKLQRFHGTAPTGEDAKICSLQYALVLEITDLLRVATPDQLTSLIGDVVAGRIPFVDVEVEP